MNYGSTAFRRLHAVKGSALAALLSVYLLPISALATTPLGDPQKPAELYRAIQEAHKQGAKDIRILPGTYDLPSHDHGDTIILDGWSDTTIHADGVTLIFEDLGHRPLSLRQCRNVTWDGGTLRFVRPTFTQGRVVAIGLGQKGTYCDWQIDTGYPTRIDPGKATFDIVDQSTRVLKVQTGDWGTRTVEPLGPGLFRLHYSRGENPGFVRNDWLVTRAPGGESIVHMNNCGNCTLRNVTLQNGGFANIFETGGAGGNHYLKCKIQPGPRPPGASEDQLVGSAADGVHSTDTLTGPDLEDCTFTGVFLDDCIAVHGGFDRVVSAEGKIVVLAHGAWDRPVVGDPLRIADTHGFFAQALCSALDELPNHDLQVTLDRDLHVPIDHSQDADKRLGTKANDPRHCGRGYKILRCRLGDTRSRGILVKADEGVIDHCTIEGCGMSGVSVGPEFWWNEANYAWNVTISNNTFRQCNKNDGDMSSVWVHGDGAMGNRNILIQNNEFERCYGKNIIRLEATDGARIGSNRFSGSFPLKSKQPPHIIWLKDSKAVKLQGNMVSNQVSPLGDLVALSKGVDIAEVQNNDAAGIAIQR